MVGQDCTHVSTKGLHVLGDEDLVLLGLIPESIKTISGGKHRVP